MEANILYTFSLIPDWKLISNLSRVDRFDGSWAALEKREGSSLKQLKSIATVNSVGASTRIEGSSLTNDEVRSLIGNLRLAKLEERDQQEVIGYYEALDEISELFGQMDITENNIKYLHNVLLKHSKKDEWHKGNYKQQSNMVEATHADGTKYIVFKTTDPGFATDEAMRRLVEWYHSDDDIHPVIRVALFVYDFLSIHPFQDGNGRMSRLLTTLLLLRNGYSWIEYMSFENEIENRKGEYYQVLMKCQQQRPGEDVYPWTDFFLNCLLNIQNALKKKLDRDGVKTQMSPREKAIYTFVETHPGCKSGEVADKLSIPLPTIKRILSIMVNNEFLIKHGIGAGTNYTIH